MSSDDVQAAQSAVDEAKATLAAAEAAQAAVNSASATAGAAAEAPAQSTIPEAAPAEPADTSAAASGSSTDAPAPPTSAAAPVPDAPLTAEQVDTIRAGYAFDGPALELGALVNGAPQPDVPIRIPLSMTNRHGLVAGATGTGKTRTLQVLLEQLAAAGVPVFAADIKGDLSGVAVPGESSDKLLARTSAIGQQWQAAASPTEFFALGGSGRGVPIRASVSTFGPLMLSKVLGLNATQESSLGLVFHFADANGLPLVDLSDLRAVLQYLTSAEGKAELDGIGGLSKATAGVILRELVNFSATGADDFFGEPEIDSAEFLRRVGERGMVSLLEVPEVASQPAVFSTFLMWLLADLYNTLPEVGDLDAPKLVFFFDEAHLLFDGASKAFIAEVVRTVRLIRSKGVGVFFITQTPKDVPDDVLAQLGSRIQHQLRAHTPNDATALRATVRTYPSSGYDLEQVLTQLATGEAIVTVMNERGAPSPVAWTRLRAPQGSMQPAPEADFTRILQASPLLAKYGTRVDPESAMEMLAARMNATAAAAQQEEERKRAETEAARSAPPETARSRERTETSTRPKKDTSVLDQVFGSRTGQTIVREVVRGVFGALRKRR